MPCSGRHLPTHPSRSVERLTRSGTPVSQRRCCTQPGPHPVQAWPVSASVARACPYGLPPGPYTYIIIPLYVYMYDHTYICMLMGECTYVYVIHHYTTHITMAVAKKVLLSIGGECGRGSRFHIVQEKTMNPQTIPTFPHAPISHAVPHAEREQTQVGARSA